MNSIDHSTTSIFNNKSNSQQCTVCETPIPLQPFTSNALDNLCHSQECRALFNQLKSMPDDQNSKCYFQQQAQRIRKMRAIDKAHQQRIDRIDSEEAAEELHSFQTTIAKQFPEKNLQDFNHLSIPSGKSKLVPLSSERIDQYKAHLQKVIAEAFADPPIVDFFDREQNEKARRTQATLKEKPALQKLISQCCGLCKGGCCTEGKNTGIISLETIKQMAAHYEGIDPDSILSLYLEKLPSHTIQDSCINQGANGCVLPSPMRSATCNGYYCESLKTLIDQPNDLSHRPTFIFQRANDRWSKYDEGTDRHIVEIHLVEDDVIRKL